MTKTAIFDYDNIIYKVGFATESRNVVVTHVPSGRSNVYKNISEFWGLKRNEIGGKLGEINTLRIEAGKRPFERNEFTHETVRESEPISKVLRTVKMMIKNACEAVGASDYRGYIGKGDSFRVERSTVLQYKGNRKDALRPLMKDEISEYILRYHNGILVEGMEADDWCIIDAYRDPNKVVIGVDKDAYGCAVQTFNPDHPEWGIINGDCFGELQLIEKPSKKDVKGYGRKFFYYQVCYGDGVDNYRSNSASDVKWGVVSAYNALKDAQNDREALEALKNVYLHLYPTPKEIIGWRGDTFEIDWMYMFNENWDLARMHRKEKGDDVRGTDVLKKFGLLED